MARDIANDLEITNSAMLLDYFSEGAKDRPTLKVGTEHEKFLFDLDTHAPIPYEGDNGIEAILVRLRDRLGWCEIADAGHIIGLYAPNGAGAISLEPGGQLELSGAAVATIHETYKELQFYLAHSNEVLKQLGVGFLSIGMAPSWKLSDMPTMPKNRYKIMTEYMPQVGSEGLNMMYRTSTIQSNLDYRSEMDMALKMRVSTKIQSLIGALFATSPFLDGELTPFVTRRLEVWKDTDNQRCGLLPFVLEKDFGFSQYAEWALDLPMYFVLRDGVYHKATHVTFRQFLNGKLRGEIADYKATMGDWINHLSTVFPDVRLKQFLEMRAADAGPMPHICALSALWVGLLYDEDNLLALEDLTADWSYADVAAMRAQAPLSGLVTQIKGRPIEFYLKPIVAWAVNGLKKRNNLNEFQQDESIYLEPLLEILNNNKTVSDQLRHLYNTAWNKDIDAIFNYAKHFNKL